MPKESDVINNPALFVSFTFDKRFNIARFASGVISMFESYFI